MPARPHACYLGTPRGGQMALLLLSLLRVTASSPSIGAWLADGTYFNATDVLHEHPPPTGAEATKLP